eukprot:COSAG06_NODE_16456_length_1000_cov_2.703663_2_plen_97_part_00
MVERAKRVGKDPTHTVLHRPTVAVGAAPRGGTAPSSQAKGPSDGHVRGARTRTKAGACEAAPVALKADRDEAGSAAVSVMLQEVDQFVALPLVAPR